jgi:hypothetical protein
MGHVKAWITANHDYQGRAVLTANRRPDPKMPLAANASQPSDDRISWPRAAVTFDHDLDVVVHPERWPR